MKVKFILFDMNLVFLIFYSNFKNELVIIIQYFKMLNSIDLSLIKNLFYLNGLKRYVY